MSEQIKTVYVVTMDGPEWSDIKGVFAKKKDATEHAKKLEDAGGYLSGMSSFNVNKHTIQGDHQR